VNRARQSALHYPIAAPPRCPDAARTSRYVPTSLLFATLTSSPQLSENTATLSPFPATLTRYVKPKSCVCHSYRKHRGWGMTLLPSRSLFPYTAPAHARKNPHTNARQPKSFHALTSHFSAYRGVGVAPSSALSVSSALKSPLHIAATPTASRKSSPATSSLSLFTTHHPRLTRSKVRFTRNPPGATHV
jgi:hypothetical protein